MRLELNLPALERLIGNDTELELNLRRNIVNEFAKRHLKSLVDEDMFHKACAEARCIVNEAAKNVFDIENLASNHVYPVASGRLKKMVEDYTSTIVDEFVRSKINKRIEDLNGYWEKYVERCITQKITLEIEKQIKEVVQKRLMEAMELFQKSLKV